ncbi:PfkB family carbohydrate kinase [Dactylosporangium sucinum]|uniref:Hydroxymethylpyrimidine kinase n=1 Tax=Dactylosporangium sucinum TaxID=1424081 RepID=A0A917UEA3_9ACTN|nr:PfkB family carbohydrate kinase [Dactylosporangium sucinum]GGM86962.1 hypothetical protein GCM10007977_106070 [Dactylosporangium sucinum]
MSDNIPVCLTIGSSDSGGGAGVQGDIKAFASVGCFATTVVVGVTAQSTDGVTGRWGVPVPAVLAQLDAVRRGFPLRAAKVGTTWSEELIRALAGPLRELAGDGVPIVVDPVMVSTAGSWLSEVGRTRAAVLETLLPLAAVITPNRREAELLAGVAAGAASRRDLAEALAGLGAAAVVITGGPDEAGDWFFDGAEHRHLHGAWHDSGAEHGAGCAHSALIAGLMSQGRPLAAAVREAHWRAAEGVRHGHTHLGTTVHPVDVLGIGAAAGDARGPALRWPLSSARPLDPHPHPAAPKSGRPGRPPRLSVILPTRDRPETLRAALASVAAQRRDDTEVVVVNDGGAPVEPVLDEFRSHLDLRLITLLAEHGPSAARNHGIEAARGEYLSFLDDDDVYLPGHLESALTALAAGDADAVYATAGVSRRRVDPIAAEPPELPHAFDFSFHDGFLSVLNYIPPTGLVVRADLAEAMRFDPDLRIGEDWDLWLRLSRHRGYRFRHLDRLGAVYHRIPAHSVSADPVGDGRRALARFHDGYRRMCARWAVPAGSPQDGYRRLVLQVYDLAFVRYDSGRTLGSFWYERMVRLLYDGFVAGRPADALAPRLAPLLEEQ